MEQLKVVDVDISQIKEAAYNPRAISDGAFQGLINSIKEFGVVDPLVVNRRSGNLVGGHQRLKALKHLGYSKVPVVFVDLSPAKEKALNITLNNTKISGFYTDGLQELLEGLSIEVQELGESFMKDLRLDLLQLPSAWAGGGEKVEFTTSNLDGITATIKVLCPQEKKDAIKEFLRDKFAEMGSTDVSVE
jgi:hypothetical protein